MRRHCRPSTSSACWVRSPRTPGSRGRPTTSPRPRPCLPRGWVGERPPMPDRSLPAEVTGLIDLVRAYAKQETIEPLKGLVRWVAAGVLGSLLLGIGTILVALGALR